MVILPNIFETFLVQYIILYTSLCIIINLRRIEDLMKKKNEIQVFLSAFPLPYIVPYLILWLFIYIHATDFQHYIKIPARRRRRNVSQKVRSYNVKIIIHNVENLLYIKY